MMGRHRLWVKKENAQMCYNRPISRSRRWDSHHFYWQAPFQCQICMHWIPLFILKCPGVFFFFFIICVCITVLKQWLNCKVFLYGLSYAYSNLHSSPGHWLFTGSSLETSLWHSASTVHNGALHSTVATMTVIRAWLLTCYLSTCDGL